ncbi:hypothetical protein EMIT0P291_60056 [Pseudomonas sp. IT-P291]
MHRMQWVYDCFAAERGDVAIRQAPSPHKASLSGYSEAMSELARHFSISSLQTQPKEWVL